jgi:AraC-like DNA-binding protein
VLLAHGEAVLELAEDASALVIKSEKRPERTAQQVASVGKPVHCARKLCYELSHMDGFSTKIVWSLCNEIFCHMERAFASLAKRNPSLKLISEIVEAELPGHIRLEATASAVGLRPRELSALIRKECGCAFREYVVRKRLDEACYRMMHTRQALGEIALQCGFADQAHFTREFKKIVGLTPARYAKANCE